MPLVTSERILRRAFEEGWAVGAFNANNLEYVQAILEACNEEKVPVILQASQGAIKYTGLQNIVDMVRNVAQNISIPVVLHLDHGTDFKQNVECLKAGFTSLMFDGSLLSFEENVRITKSLVDMAHAVGVPVEAELGRVGGTEEGIDEEEVEMLMTNPDEALKFVELTGVDSLAVAVGSIHRMLKQEAKLDLERIKKIKDKTGIPLVLHGSSGVMDEYIKEGIKLGISKINVATELNKAFVKGMAEGLEKLPGEVDPRKILAYSKRAVKEVVKEKVRLFGSPSFFNTSWKGGDRGEGEKLY